MEVVGQDFKRQYLALQEECGLADELFKPRFDRIYQHLAPALGAPDDVVV